MLVVMRSAGVCPGADPQPSVGDADALRAAFSALDPNPPMILMLGVGPPRM